MFHRHMAMWWLACAQSHKYYSNMEVAVIIIRFEIRFSSVKLCILCKNDFIFLCVKGSVLLHYWVFGCQFRPLSQVAVVYTKISMIISYSFIHAFIAFACAKYDDFLPFSGAYSVPLCNILFPATHFHKLFFHYPSLHLAIYFLVLFIPNSYKIIFWEFNLLPFSVHVQTNTIYVALLSLLWMDFLAIA
jgi:hypothetical protein